MPLFQKGGSPQQQDPKQAKKALKSVLGKLDKDQNNPDLWLEAARAHMILESLEEAKTCAENSLALDKTRGDAKLLLDDIEVMIDAKNPQPPKGEAEPAPESAEGEKAGEQGAIVEEVLPEGAKPAPEAPKEEPEPEPEELVMKTEQAVPWVPEEERSRFKDAKEALEAFQTELTPASTITCPSCNTLLEVEAEWCYGCGRDVGETTETLEQRLKLARSRLKKDHQDKDALFTMAAYHAVNDEHQEALEALTALTTLDETYPGLWWLKARVHELMGNREEAEAAAQKAMEMGPPVAPSP